MSAQQDQFLLFPPPRRTTDRKIMAVIVEKKGDETRTSMKQDEMHCYSPWIRIRDGCMILQKIHWSQYEIGDWIMCNSQYAIDKSGRIADEKELSDLEKVDPVHFERCFIPPTSVVNGNVRIECQFILCPSFIKNRETRNSFGGYKKLFLLNIGQGYVHESNHAFEMLRTRIFYTGIFEFCAKTNGAVNFSRRNVLRNEKDRLLERDAMWQLVDVVHRRRTPEGRDVMKAAINKLRQEAQMYDDELKTQGVPQPTQLLENDQMPSTSSAREIVVEKSDENSNENPEDTPEGHSEENPEVVQDLAQEVTPEKSPEDSTPEEQLQEYVSCMIVRGMFPNWDGEMIEQWKDKETGQTSTDKDLLIFKVKSRYGLDESLAPSAPPTTPIAQGHRTPEFFPETSAAGPLEPVHTVLLAPDPTPEEPEVEHRIGDTTMMTMLRQDNNANPGTRPNTPRHH